jgi:uncharacterized membrane-anchored protein
MKNFSKLILAVLPFILISISWISYLEMEKANGAEVTLKVVSMDPNDIFRGDYVNLNYDISRFEVPVQNKDIGYGSNNACIVLDSSSPAQALNILPRSESKNGIFICGSSYYNPKNYEKTEEGGYYQTTFENINRYYVPLGKGAEIDKAARENRLNVVLSVTKTGNAYIKYLTIDGQKVNF